MIVIVSTVCSTVYSTVKEMVFSSIAMKHTKTTLKWTTIITIGIQLCSYKYKHIGLIRSSTINWKTQYLGIEVLGNTLFYVKLMILYFN